MKKLLFIAVVNINKRSGAGLATLAYYNAISALYPGRVDLMMPSEACVGKYSEAIGVPPRSIFKALLSGSMHRYKSFLNEYLRNHKEDYSLCVINGGRYAGDMMKMIHNYGLKIIVIHHNFEREYCMDNKTIDTLWGLTPFFVNRIEKKAYVNADCNCFLTPEDLFLFRNHYGEVKGGSFVVGVFEPYPIKTTINAPVYKKKIVITGSMNSTQTMCGIKDVSENYYDIIKAVCPDWELIIAGRNPRKEVYDLKKLSNDSIIVIPNPEVMDDITRPASIYLCPTNVGGGLKLRVMDGLRQGLPVLVHRVSARGYNSFYEKPYFQIYNDRESFEIGLKRLKRFVDNGFSKQEIQDDYINIFGFERGCKGMNSVFESLQATL